MTMKNVRYIATKKLNITDKKILIIFLLSGIHF